MSTLHADLIAAWRSLVARPLATLAIILTLGIGLGATAAMFTVTDAVLLRPLPFPDEATLVRMTERHTTRPQSGASIPALDDWTKLPGIATIGAYETSNGITSTGGDPIRIDGQMVSPGFFPTMGIRPALGRTMSTADPFLDSDPKVVLSDRLWRERFGARPNVVGELMRLDRRSYTVIGVMPPEFDYPAGTLFWTTLPTNMKMLLDSRDLRFMDAIARVTPGTDVASVEARMRAWADQQRAADPKGMADWVPDAWPLREEIVGTVRKPIVVTFAGVGLLLLVACCNVASLLLAQGHLRQRTLAVRVALGATRRRLVRQLLLEGGVLSSAGVFLALVISFATQRAIVALSLEQIPRIDLMSVDWRAFAAVSALGVVTTFLCALGPALVSSRVDSGALMGRATRTVVGDRRRLLPALAAAEFALAIVLVAAAGLLINSYRQLLNVDLGFSAKGAVAMRLTMPIGEPWNDTLLRRRTYDAVLTNLRAAAGVGAVGLISRLPLEPIRGGVEVSAVGGTSDKILTVLQETSENYLGAVGARLIDGRDFLTADRVDQPVVALINDVLARYLFPGESAIGKTVRYEFMRGPVQAQVIGVVHAVQYGGLTGETKPEIYMTYRQSLAAPMSLVVRSTGDAMALVPSIRAAVADADPTRALTLDGISTLDDQVGKQFARPRFFLTLVGTFAMIALLLSSLGLYGMLSFWTAQHRRELGVRLALGATREHVAALVVKRGLIVVGVGLFVGLGITVTTGKYLESLLFGVPPADLPTLLIAAGVLVLIAVLVCAVPGRQAARVDPIEILRAE